MAWDFSTEPEFEEQLAWMRQVVRDELFPLETLALSYDAMLEALEPLQQEVKSRGLWASHLPPELGGGGFGQVKLGLMHEILGQTPYGPVAFGNNAPNQPFRPRHSCFHFSALVTFNPGKVSIHLTKSNHG